MDKAFIYWDNANIFHEAQRLAEEREDEPDARYRVRMSFENLLRLASAGREIEHAVAAGSVPPEMRQLWNRIEGLGVKVELFDRGAPNPVNRKFPIVIFSFVCWRMRSTIMAIPASLYC